MLYLWSWQEGGTHPILVERGFCFGGAFFGLCRHLNVLTNSKEKNVYRGIELDFGRTRTEVWFVSMSFKSLKEFGVSAERLGSICKRWMTGVQRSVCKIVFSLVQSFCQCNITLLIISACVYCSFHFWYCNSDHGSFCCCSLISGFQYIYTFQEMFVLLEFMCEWDKGAVVTGKLVVIDSVSLRLALKQNAKILFFTHLYRRFTALGHIDRCSTCCWLCN